MNIFKRKTHYDRVSLINEKCPLRKMDDCSRQCAWRIDDGCALKVLAVVAITLENN